SVRCGRWSSKRRKGAMRKGERKTLELPRLAEVASEIHIIAAGLQSCSECEGTGEELVNVVCPACDGEGLETCDVRLQVYEDGDWAIRFGDSSYDQDHRGFWGASIVHAEMGHEEV